MGRKPREPEKAVQQQTDERTSGHVRGRAAGARGDDKAEARDEAQALGARLEPIGVVERELTRPDGSKVVVEVPVYPPFRLAEHGAARRGPRARNTPTLKGRRNRPQGSDSSSGSASG